MEIIHRELDLLEEDPFIEFLVFTRAMMDGECIELAIIHGGSRMPRFGRATIAHIVAFVLFDAVCARLENVDAFNL